MNPLSRLNTQTEYESPAEFFRRMRVKHSALQKFGFKKDSGSRNELVEVVNMRRTEGMDGPRFLPAYHMNKKTWTTIVLDGSAGKGELLGLLSESRKGAGNGKSQTSKI